MSEHHRPVYPELSDAQWALLVSFTDQRCSNLMEAADFIADLSPEAKEFLRTADRKKIKALNDNTEFFATSKAVWKFLWIGGGGIIAVVIAISQLWKAIGDFFTFKMK